MNIQQAISNNNDAVRLMLEGNGSDAVGRLASSLRFIMQPITVQAQNVTTSTPSSTNVCSTLHLGVDSIELPDLPNTATGGPYIFQKAMSFVIPQQNEEGSRLVHHEAFDATYSACIIFNIALLNHRIAMTGNDSQRRTLYLEKAAELYKLGIEILHNVGSEIFVADPSSSSPQHTHHAKIVTTILVGSTNNLSLIEFQLGRYLDARTNICYLSCLLYEVQKYFSTSSHQLFLNDEWNGLVANTFLLLAGTLAPAA